MINKWFFYNYNNVEVLQDIAPFIRQNCQIRDSL